ncbi:MAG: aminotransferase class IV, partial [Holophagales bacterium]|nr:aminotransferase class IV [Holophagales bacterium]
GSVAVRSLFDVVKLPTLWQMTSTVAAKSNAPVSEIFAALFPCASVTGAPKAASVQLIAATEDAPRETYTGAIGYVGPGRRARFNVAIRTAWIDKETGKSVYGIGSGIVADSLPADEFDECLLKSRVLTEDRGAAGFELLETLRWTSGSGYFLLEYHLERLRQSAEYFDFPFDRATIDEHLAKLAKRLGNGGYRIRLLLTSDGRTRVTWSPVDEKRPVKEQPLRLAKRPVDRDDPFLYHKTTRRDVYEEAMQQAGGAGDVLLWNGDGFVTESTVANVVVRTGGHLVTPPVSCGLLAGTYRQWLLEEGKIEERPVHVDELAEVDALYLTNSVRGCYPASLVRDERPRP